MKYIKQQHGMTDESWMEWQSWTEISGKYLLHYFHSSMTQFTGAGSDGKQH